MPVWRWSLATFNSSRMRALGLRSRSRGPLLWLRTSRLCLSSTGFVRAISGSSTAHRCISEWILMRAGILGTGCDEDATPGVTGIFVTCYYSREVILVISGERQHTQLTHLYS